VVRAAKHRDASLGTSSKLSVATGAASAGGATSKKDPNTWLGDEDSDWEMYVQYDVL